MQTSHIFTVEQAFPGNEQVRNAYSTFYRSLRELQRKNISKDSLAELVKLTDDATETMAADAARFVTECKEFYDIYQFTGELSMDIHWNTLKSKDKHLFNWIERMSLTRKLKRKYKTRIKTMISDFLSQTQLTKQESATNVFSRRS